MKAVLWIGCLLFYFVGLVLSIALQWKKRPLVTWDNPFTWPARFTKDCDDFPKMFDVSTHSMDR